MAAILENGESWNCWSCLNHLKWIPHAHKHIFRPKIHDYVTIMSKIMNINGFLQPYFAAILDNGDLWSCWGCQNHLYWIPHAHKHIFRPKIHDYMTIISKLMAKKSFWQPFWKMVTSEAVEVVTTSLNEFLMSITYI